MCLIYYTSFRATSETSRDRGHNVHPAQSPSLSNFFAVLDTPLQHQDRQEGNLDTKNLLQPVVLMLSIVFNTALIEYDV